MKISELIERLQQEQKTYGDLEVRLTWETVVNVLEQRDIAVSRDYPAAYWKSERDENLALIINAESGVEFP